MALMELKPITGSTNIAAAGYNSETQELQIEFKGGGLYAYDSVPEFLHRDLIDARSVGGFFHKHIKDKFKTRKLK